MVHPLEPCADSIGSTYVKAVLSDHYEALDIADRDAARLEFTKLLDGEYSDDDAHRVRQDLIKCCGLDTMVMKLIVDALRE